MRLLKLINALTHLLKFNAHKYLLLLVVPPVVSLAQSTDVTFHHLTIDNGLPSGLIHCIYQDANSFMWFGTDAGLCRYDGLKCRVYQYDPNDSFSLHGNHVYSIAEDYNKGLWILTEQGLNLFNRAADNFIFYALPGLPNKPHLRWDIIKQKPNNLLIRIADRVLLSFNIIRHTCEVYPQGYEYDCYHFATSEKNELAVPFLNRPGDSWHPTYSNNKALIRELGAYKAIMRRDIAATSADFVYARDSIFWTTDYYGLVAYNWRRKTSTVYFPGANKKKLLATSLIDYNGKFWIGTQDEGIWIFDIAKRSFCNHYTHNDNDNKSLALNNALNCAFVDNEGNIWLDVFAKGIDYFNPAEKKFATWLSDDDARTGHFDNFVRALAQDSSGNVWCGTYNGSVYKIDKNKHINALFTESGEKHFHSIEKIFVDNHGRVWVLDHCLNLLDKSSSSFKRIIGDGERTIAHDINATTGNRIFFIDSNYCIAELNESNGKFSYKETSIKNVYNSLSVFFIDNEKRIYVNDGSGNILIYAPLQDDYYLLKKLSFQGYIKSHLEKDSIIWIGTTSGLLCLNKMSFTYKVFTQKNGLPENTVYSVLDDGRGNLWMSTNKGVSKFNTAKPSFRNYSTEDGLQSNEFNTNAYLQCRDGEIYLGGIHGVNIFYPSLIADDAAAPPVQIDYININDERYYRADVALQHTIIKLPYEQRTVSFSFTGIDYLHPTGVQMQYHLTGIDQDWINTSNPGFARYANLPPGKYNFEIRAVNKNGVPGKTTSYLTFIIATPYYQSWWFITLMVVCIACILYAWYSYRIMQVKRIHLVRNRIARDLHDDIGSSITSIRIMSDMAKETVDKSPLYSGELINKIGSESQRVMDAIRDIVWAINPDNDPLGNMLIRMQEHAAEVFDASQIEYSFDVGEQIENVKLSMQMRRDVYLIFKEAVNNLAKYAYSTSVAIRLYRNGSRLVLVITDNGVGFNKQDVKKGNGLRNMQQRAAALRAEFFVDSEKNKGTSVVLDMPIP